MPLRAQAQDPSFVQFTIDFPRTQEAQTNPEEWNSKWEKYFNQFDLPPDMIFMKEVQSNTSFHRSVQYRVGGRACHALLTCDLGRKWTTAGEDVRRKHTLRALSEACAMANNLNQARAYCSDILRLNHLSKDGKTLISLLRAMIPEDLSNIPKTPYYFPEARWDSLRKQVEKEHSANSIEKITFDETFHLRTKLIYHVLEFMFMSFLGWELDKVRVMKNTSVKVDKEAQKLATKGYKANLESIYGREAAKEIRKDDLAAWKDRKAKRGYFCMLCHKAEGEEKFSRCSECWNKQQRDWKYCSKTCQKKDWAEGNHKKICGKPLTAETALESAPPLRPEGAPEVRQVGPPRNGFKRSPALVQHVYMLNLNPTADLFLKTGTGQGGFMKTDTPYLPIQNRVRAARDKAMCEGDKQSASLLCHYITWFCWAKHWDTKQGYDFKMMVEQMEKEYEYPDLKQAMLKLQEKQFRDPIRRPPLVADLHPLQWAGFIALDHTDVNRRLTF